MPVKDPLKGRTRPDGTPVNAALIPGQQARKVAQAQQDLDRIERMYEEMKKRVEEETRKLNELIQENQRIADQLAQPIQTTPPTSARGAFQFRTQYDQFDNTPSNERLTKVDVGTPISSIQAPRTRDRRPNEIDYDGHLRTPESDKTQYSFADQDIHLEEVDPASNFSQGYYVSGYYNKSGAGSKEYEYRLLPGAGNVQVGQTVRAVVHPVGYHTGAYHAGGNRRVEHEIDFTITDIHTERQFLPYMDNIPNV